SAMVLHAVNNLLTSSDPDGTVETSPTINGLLQRIATAVASGQPLDANTLASIETPPSLGGGGGGALSGPVITSFSISPGPNSILTLIGRGFTGATEVDYTHDTEHTSYQGQDLTVIGDTQVKILVPPSLISPDTFRVVTPTGTSPDFVFQGG